MLRTISTYSRVRSRGLPNGTPCQPSLTWGPELPSPRRNRPRVRWSSVIAVIAVAAGVRAGICITAVLTPVRSVLVAYQVGRERASDPEASALHRESNLE